MSRKIIISLDGIEVEAVLYDNVTADKIWDELPLEGVGNLWGEEVYFRTHVNVKLDNSAKRVVELGDLGFWPPSSAFCLFYGQTPDSTEGEIRPASAVNVFGKITSDISVLKNILDDCNIVVEKKL